MWFKIAEGFEWETAIVSVDARQRYGETRFEAKGYIGLRLYVMIFTLRETAVRIISLRKANSREMKRYVHPAAWILNRAETTLPQGQNSPPMC